MYLLFWVARAVLLATSLPKVFQSLPWVSSSLEFGSARFDESESERKRVAGADLEELENGSILVVPTLDELLLVAITPVVVSVIDDIYCD